MEEFTTLGQVTRQLEAIEIALAHSWDIEVSNVREHILDGFRAGSLGHTDLLDDWLQIYAFQQMILEAEKEAAEVSTYLDSDAHPSGCHSTVAGETPDCESDGHHSCKTCTKRWCEA